jgi:tetratricopeptide (TPR) repeat protein
LKFFQRIVLDGVNLPTYKATLAVNQRFDGRDDATSAFSGNLRRVSPAATMGRYFFNIAITACIGVILLSLGSIVAFWAAVALLGLLGWRQFSSPLSRARRHLNQGHPQRALRACDRAIQLDPKKVEGYDLRASLRLQLQDYAGAVADLNEVLRLEPNVVEAWADRADARLQLGDCAGAISDSSRAIRLDPQYTQAYYTRSLAYYEQKQLEAAVADVCVALSQKPDHAPAKALRDNLVDALYLRILKNLQQQDYDQMLSACNAALRLKPNFLGVYILRAQVYLQAGYYQNAIQDCNRALRLDPDDDEALRYRKAAEQAEREQRPEATAEGVEAAACFQPNDEALILMSES